MRHALALTIFILATPAAWTTLAHAEVSASILRECDLALAGQITAPSIPNVTAPSRTVFASVGQARHRIEMARRTMGYLISPAEVEELDQELARVIRLKVPAGSPKLARLSELFGRVEDTFKQNVREFGPEMLGKLRLIVDLANRKGQRDHAKNTGKVAAEFEACLAKLVVDECASIWLRVNTTLTEFESVRPTALRNAAAAAAPTNPRAVPIGSPSFAPPKAPPRIQKSYFKSLGQARFRLTLAKSKLRRYLEPEDFATLERELDVAERTRTPVDSPMLRPLEVLFRKLDVNVTKDFDDHLEEVVEKVKAHLAAMTAKNNRTGAASMDRILSTLDECRERFDVYSCGPSLAYALHELPSLKDLGSAAKSESAETKALNAMMAAVVRSVPEPTAGHFDELEQLTVLTSTGQGPAFKDGFERTYMNHYAVARESRREGYAAAGRPAQGYAKIPDLNRALSIFTAPPRVVVEDSKVVLQGPTVLYGTTTRIDVTFDPRTRYFTVQVPGLSGLDELYYQLVVEAGGQLKFLMEPPVSMRESGKRLPLTHFAY